MNDKEYTYNSSSNNQDNLKSVASQVKMNIHRFMTKNFQNI